MVMLMVMVTAKSSGQLHQLQTKQQQLVAQLQVVMLGDGDGGDVADGGGVGVTHERVLTLIVSVCPACDHPGHVGE